MIRDQTGDSLTFFFGFPGQRTAQLSVTAFKTRTELTLAVNNRDRETYLDVIPTAVSTGCALNNVAPNFSCSARHASAGSASLRDLLWLI
jgi:hypothetical protein